MGMAREMDWEFCISHLDRQADALADEGFPDVAVALRAVALSISHGIMTPEERSELNKRISDLREDDLTNAS